MRRTPFFPRVLLFLPLAALILVYAKFAISGLLLDKECLSIVEALGFGAPITTLLVYMIFPLDGTVALLLMFGARLHRRFPWHLLFLWVGLWPWVPRVLQWYGGFQIEYGEAALVSVLALAAYYLHRYHGIGFFLRRR